MFVPYEAALIEHFRDVIPGVPVFGSFDEPDFERDPVYIQVVWQGYLVADQSASRSAASIAQRFSVHIGVDTARLDPAKATVSANGLATLFERLLAFSYRAPSGARVRPEIQQPPAPAYAGAAAELAIFFTLPGVVSAQTMN